MKSVIKAGTKTLAVGSKLILEASGIEARVTGSDETGYEVLVNDCDEFASVRIFLVLNGLCPDE
jgi:hypothetical protein